MIQAPFLGAISLTVVRVEAYELDLLLSLLFHDSKTPGRNLRSVKT